MCGLSSHCGKSGQCFDAGLMLLPGDGSNFCCFRPCPCTLSAPLDNDASGGKLSVFVSSGVGFVENSQYIANLFCVSCPAHIKTVSTTWVVKVSPHHHYLVASPIQIRSDLLPSFHPMNIYLYCSYWYADAVLECQYSVFFSEWHWHWIKWWIGTSELGMWGPLHRHWTQRRHRRLGFI